MVLTCAGCGEDREVGDSVSVFYCRSCRKHPEIQWVSARAIALAEAKEAVAQAILESSWAAASRAGADVGPSIETCRVHQLCLTIEKLGPLPRGVVLSHEAIGQVRAALARVQMFGGLPGAETMFVADALTLLERDEYKY